MLFLDEPTTGLDPRGRNEVWAAVRALVAGGTTVLLTTQMLEEADQLADRIAVIDHGRVIAEDTPLGAEGVAARRLDRGRGARRASRSARRAPALSRCGAREAEVDARRAAGERAGRATAWRALGAPWCASWADAAEDVTLRRPTLDEVFLALTADEVGARA